LAASLNQKKNSNLFAFESYISKKFNKKFNNDFQKILDGVLKILQTFGTLFGILQELNGIKGIKKIKRSKVFYKNLFLPGSKLILQIIYYQKMIKKKQQLLLVKSVSEKKEVGKN
jgi:acetoacetyl-CoA synthetase